MNRPSPYILLLFPIILILGSLFAILSPVAAPPPSAYSSDLPIRPSTFNYFAGKRNILNLFFVKIGWFWTTMAFLLLQLTTNPPQLSRPPFRTRHFLQAAARYGLVTLAWIFVTQWFFGPALIDRSFKSTGGRCEARADQPISNKDVDLESILTGLACKAIGGRWKGGHDISGHVFMLVLSSAFLFFEFFLSDAQSSHPNVSPAAAAAIAANTTPEEKKAVGGWESESMAKARLYTRYFVWIVIALDLWMLLMTAIWFHTWLEKVSALILAESSVWAVYFMPRLVPIWKMVVGGV